MPSHDENPRYDDTRNTRRDAADRENEARRGAGGHADPGVLFLGRIERGSPPLAVTVVGQPAVATAYRVAQVRVVFLTHEEIEGKEYVVEETDILVLATGGSRAAAPVGALVLVAKIDDRYVYFYT